MALTLDISHDVTTVSAEIAGLFGVGGLDGFLEAYYGMRAFYAPGSIDKSNAIYSWDAFNVALNQTWIDFPRLRLAKAGHLVSHSSYTDYETPFPGYFNGVRGRVDKQRLAEQLSKGATALIDAVDAIHAPLKQFVSGLEAAFNTRFQANAYASFSLEPGFDKHCDNHDVFVFQITGAKTWRIEAPDQNRVPVCASKLNVILEAGDFLYLPEGWWHQVTPLELPSLHLTIAAKRRKLADYLAWLSRRLDTDSAANRSLAPNGRSSDDDLRDLGSLKEWLIKAISLDSLNEYRQATGVARDTVAEALAPQSILALLCAEQDEFVS